MEISNAHRNKAMSSHQLEQVLAGISFPNNNNSISISMDDNQLQLQEKKVMTRPPNAEHSLKCPRCDSTNTKFCYYNNYSLSQPRYFCKGCRRYWTQGGSLRNVPVGGGCRKNNKRISAAAASNSKKPHQLPLPAVAASQQLLPPPKNDLSLAANFLDPAGSATFLDVLRSTAHNNYVESGNYNNNNDMSSLFPFEGGHRDLDLGTGSGTAVEAGSWIGSHGSDDIMNIAGIDATMMTRDYWNGVGSSYWHGVINSSFM